MVLQCFTRVHRAKAQARQARATRQAVAQAEATQASLEHTMTLEADYLESTFGPSVGSSVGPSAASDWTELYDADSGHYYYQNERTGQTQWDRPAEMDQDPPNQDPPVEDEREKGGLVMPGRISTGEEDDSSDDGYQITID